MFFNFGQMLIDGGGEPTPAKQSEKAPTVTSSFNPGRFRQAEERSMQEYQSYRSGERQSTVVDERTKIAEAKAAEAAQKAAELAAKRAAEDKELAQQRALAKKAQDDAKIAVSEAQEALRRAREAQAKAQQDEAIRRAEEELRRAKEEEERRKRAALEADNSPSNTTYFSAPDPIPLTPSTIVSQPTNISPVTQTPPPPPVKTAPIDTILFDEEAVPIQIMSDLIFENIGGQELINVARNDTVNGQQIIYQPIKNLTQIQQEYNPNNILALQATSDKYFKNFAIKFETKVPNVGGGPDGEHIYIDPTTGELIVEAINMQEDEQIEVEITTGGTIYEAEL
jgi:flagellar biosynthesis GTPase FlhF